MSGLLSLYPVALLGLLVGLFVGAIGIGGVVLVPSLVYLGGMEVQVAIATCMSSYVFSGAVGMLEFARRGSVNWPSAAWLCAGAAPGAYLGAATVPLVSPLLLEVLIAALVSLSGIHALLARRGAMTPVQRPATHSLAAVGLLVGFGSSLTGTGGPLLLMPVLLWLQLPILAAVGLSQVISIPIAALATVANLGLGNIDFGVAATLALVLMLGVLLGARMAHRIPVKVLRVGIAVVLVMVGGAIFLRIAWALTISA